MTLKLYPGEIKKFTALALIGLVALGVVAYHRVPVGELAINLHEIPYYSVALRYLPYFEPLKPIELIANTPRISAETGGQYPFLVPWAWAAVFALFGENLTTLRFFYLFLYFVFLVGLYLVGETIDRRWGWIIGGTGCFFALTSPFMLYNITSGYAPEEIFVLAFTPLAILAFIRASGSGSTKASIAAGFVPVIGFFVKYSYGFLLFAIYVAAHLLRSALVRTPGRLRVLLLMAAPFSLVLLFYLLSPGGAEFVLKFVTKSRILERDNLAQASQLANLKTAFGQADPLYYFKAVFSRAGHFDYRAGFFVGPLAVGLALLGVATFFATAMRNMRDRGTLILAVFFFLPALGLSFHMVKAKIYMIPFVTGLWLLCGVQVRNWLRWTSMKGQRTTHILSMAALVVLCASVTAGALPYYLRHDREQAEINEIARHLEARLDPASPKFLFLNDNYIHKQINGTNIFWILGGLEMGDWFDGSFELYREIEASREQEIREAIGNVLPYQVVLLSYPDNPRHEERTDTLVALLDLAQSPLDVKEWPNLGVEVRIYRKDIIEGQASRTR